MKSLKLGTIEARRVFGHPLLTVAICVVTIVPLLYGALYLWAFWDPYAHIKDLPVALVNQDVTAYSGDTTISAGADMAKELRDAGTFKWEEMSAAEASAALREHRVYASLNIPRDFSAHLASADTTTPMQAQLIVTANNADNMLVGQIGARVFVAVRDAAATSAESGYVAAMFMGFADARTGMSDAADGAWTLHSGLVDARKGSVRISDGLSTAGGGAGSLMSGLKTLTSGAITLKAGASRVATGAATLASSLGGAKAGAAGLDAGARRLSGGLGTLSDGLAQLTAASPRLRDAGAALSTGAASLDTGVRQAADQLSQMACATTQLHAASSQVAGALDAFVAAHPEVADDPTFAAARAGSRQVSGGLGQLDARLSAATPLFSQLTAGSNLVKTGASDLSGALTGYTSGVSASAAGASSAAAGASTLAAGTGSLAQGMTSAAAGADALAGGSTAVAGGATKLAIGAAKATAGSTSLASGLTTLSGGAFTLAGGLTDAASGSSALATGLADGTARLPDDSTSLRAKKVDVMSDPVKLDTVERTSVANYGTGFASYFIPLALWVGALMIFFIVRPIPPRALASNASDFTVAFSGFLPAAVVGMIQASVLLAVVHFGLGLEPVMPLATWGLAILTAITFAAILQFISSALGPAGKLLGIVLLMLQLTSAAGTFPLETVPRFFQTISPYLPMTYVVRGLRQTLAGGDMTVVLQCVAIIAVFLVLALLGTVLTARRQRVWTMDRLRPALTI